MKRAVKSFSVATHLFKGVKIKIRKSLRFIFGLFFNFFIYLNIINITTKHQKWLKAKAICRSRRVCTRSRPMLMISNRGSELQKKQIWPRTGEGGGEDKKVRTWVPRFLTFCNSVIRCCWHAGTVKATLPATGLSGV